MTITATIDLSNVKPGIDHHASVTIDVAATQTAYNVEFRAVAPVNNPYAETFIARADRVAKGRSTLHAAIGIPADADLPSEIACEVFVYGPDEGLVADDDPLDNLTSIV